MVEIHVYGRLRHRLTGVEAGSSAVLHLEPRPGETVASLLERLNIQTDEVYHIFLNGLLLATHNAMAPWLGYRQVREEVWDWNIDVAVGEGDRIGLFGHDMASLVV